MLVALVLVSLALLVALVASLVLLRREQERAVALRHELDEAHEALARERRPRTPGARKRNRAVRAAVGAAVESAQRLREGGVSGLLMSSIEDLTLWATVDRGTIAAFASPSGDVAILFSDIEDSTALNDQLGDEQWVTLLSAHDTVVREAIDAHGGHIVKSQGDGFMIVFADPGAAVRAGIDLQDALAASTRKPLRRTPIKVRVGIHSGPAVERDGDFFGRNVAMAARVAAQARGGQIVVSDDVRTALATDDQIVLVDFRETELKGLPGLHRLWEVSVL